MLADNIWTKLDSDWSLELKYFLEVAYVAKYTDRAGVTPIK